MKSKDKLYLPKRIFNEAIIKDIRTKEMQPPKQHWHDKRTQAQQKYLSKVA